MFLDFGTFYKKNNLYNNNIFISNNCFDYLGDNLKVWLSSFLDSLGVKDTPVILSDIDTTHIVIEGRVFIDKNVSIEPFSYIKGPCYIGANTSVRQGAYIRGNVYAGSGCVLGHTTEIKSAIFLDGAKAGHFSYVGDSILGSKCNLGAGTKLANFKFDGSSVSFKDPDTNKSVQTDLRKLGAIIGDGSQLGCNSVTNPGTILFPNSRILPCSFARGIVRA